MRERPAGAIRRFEVVMLRPLNLVLPVAVVVCLLKTAWVLAVIMAGTWFAVGAIGQSLPHRKKETVSELANRRTLPADEGRLSHDDAYAMAKAIQRLTFVVGLGALAIGWKIGLRWYWTLLLAFGSCFVVGFLSALCAAKSPTNQQPSEMSLGVPDWTEEEKVVLFGRGTREDGSEKAATLRQNLLRKVAWDEAVVERLIEFERTRLPDAPLHTLLESAIERWERDNR